MIQEMYCSYEVSKLLKEKGFDWECISYYVDDEPHDIKYSFLGETNSTWESRCCSAPTHQMAMKWLREIHNVFIIIEPYSDTSCYFSLWQGDIYRENPLKKGFPSYEETVEAALKYVLKNLI